MRNVDPICSVSRVLSVVAGDLFVCGGYDGGACLNSVERFDPSTNEWTLISPMHYFRSSAGVVACDGSLFVVGGCDGMRRLMNGERYYPDSNVWSTIADMAIPRCNFGVEVGCIWCHTSR